MKRSLAALGVASVVACSGEQLVEPTVVRPEIVAASVAPNPANVLSALVAVEARNADRVEVWFHPAGQAGDSVTPAAGVDGEAVALPVFGLLPETRYMLRVAAYGGVYVTVSDSLELHTGAPPSDLPLYRAWGLDPSPGYVVFAAGKYGLVIDNTGRVVWYHWFPDGPGLNFMPQPNGRYVARPTTPSTTDVELWVEVDPLGNVTRSFGCVGGLTPRFHDLISEINGGYWIMCDEIRVMDLTTVGGMRDARVTGTVVQHVGANGELLFRWSVFDHFAITDLAPEDRSGPAVNWTHGNAILLDSDGNLLISFRSLSEITKINTTTGAVMWRMGGLANQFNFVDTPTPAFSRQHGLRLGGAGELIMLDNSGDPNASRAERYLVHQSTRTAQLIQSYSSATNAIALLGGTVQSLPGSRILVAFGNGGRVEEFDALGRMVWEIEGNAGYVFRATRISSLYRPGVDTTR